MIKLEKAKAMKCFGRLVETIELDPDPNAQDEQTEAFNCKECEFHEYCCKLANTLSQYPDSAPHADLTTRAVNLGGWNEDKSTLTIERS